MSDPIVVWDEVDDPDGNTAHVADHGLTQDEVEYVLLDSTNSVGTSRTSGRPCRFGWTDTGKHIIVIWEELHDDPEMIYPMTAYEVPPPAYRR